MPKANIIAANGGLGKGDRRRRGMRLIFFHIDVVSRKKNLHFAVRRNIIARRAISFPKEISFAEGKHPCRRRRLGEGGPSKTGDEVDPSSGWGGVLSFLRKRKVPKENLLAKNCVFRERQCGGGGDWSRRIGLYEADPPMGRVEGAWRRKEVLRRKET